MAAKTDDTLEVAIVRTIVRVGVALGVALGGLILATDDGDRIDALERKSDARFDALERKSDARFDALEAKIDDIRVYIASKHGDRITFTPMKRGRNPIWLIKSVNPATGAVEVSGTLSVRGDTERRAVLEVGGDRHVQEWIHSGTADTLNRAMAATVRVLAD